MKLTKIAIDASNLNSGGGLTHLFNVLENTGTQDHKYFNIILWGGAILDKLPNSTWIIKISHPLLNKKSYINYLIWRLFVLPIWAKSVDIVFVPGGISLPILTKFVSMSQNMLVFESIERNRFPFGKTYLRYRILELLQYFSLKTSVANIFISEYAHKFITDKYPSLNKKPYKIIYHGVSSSFKTFNRTQLSIDKYDSNKKFKILYVSTINFYKHQWILVDAVIKLVKEGFPLELHLVGDAHPKAFKKLEPKLKSAKNIVIYHGAVDHKEIGQFYLDSDLFAFLSTCENMPNILLEAMASGLPICSSSYGPMPEILGDAGVYFDPLNVDSVYQTLKMLLLDPAMRGHLSTLAVQRVKQFTWEKTSIETFKFITSFLKN